MAQLKPSFVMAIGDSLETNRFSKEDFDLDLPKSGKNLLVIIFKHKTDYRLWLTQEIVREEVKIKHGHAYATPTEKTVVNQVEKTQITIAPGEHKTQETFEISDPGEALKYIPKWCEYIFQDLAILIPRVDPLEALRKKFSEQIETNFENPEQPFSDEELLNVNSRIDQMYSDLESLKEDLKFSKMQFAQIRQEFDQFKSTAASLPKGMWAKITANKLVRFFGGLMNTPEGRQFLFSTLPKTLGMKSDA